MKDLDTRWSEMKPQILAILEAGWSKSIAFKRVGLIPTQRVWGHYQKDQDFKEIVKTYHQNVSSSVYDQWKGL